MQKTLAPINDAIVTAMANLVDDSQSERRYPSHNDLDFLIQRTGLSNHDPKTYGQVVGKRKRVRAVLSASVESDQESGRELVSLLLNMVRANGGFRQNSTNFVGNEAIDNLSHVFREEGYHLSSDGELLPVTLEGMPDREYTQVLWSYIRRARQGALDAALVIGTGKDLLEATAKHVIAVKTGETNLTSNFPTLLAQAFMQLDMVTSRHSKEQGESPIRDYERALFDLGCSLNRLRNREGTGHGRLFLPTVTDDQVRNVIQAVGVVCDYMLSRL